MTSRVPGLLCILALASAAAARVHRDQGVPDTRALIGRIFKLKIPQNAFIGPIDRYECTEAGETSLPGWLQFNAEQQIFQGVPAPSDAGQLYVCLKAIGGDSSAKDVFSIDVTDGALADDYCPFGKEETTGNILLDVTLTELKVFEKYQTLESLASFFNVPDSKFQLSALPRDESSFDPNAVRAGPGNTFRREHEGTRVQFKVGCSGEVSPEFEPVVERLGKSSSNGELADLLGYPIIGWQISAKSRSEMHFRSRRNVGPFQATPVPKVPITRWPTYTERIDQETREVVPGVRIVPTMSSPRYVDRTYDHKHRHHHGQDVLRRQQIFLSAEIHPSPTYRYLPTDKQTPRGTPLPTPVLYPDKPTTTVVPTRVYDVDGTASIIRQRPVHVTEDVLSRWYVPTSDLTTVDIRPTRSLSPVEPTKIMPQMPNFKPTVNSRIKKLSLVAGKAWSYTIPIDTFVDMEDGNTRDLKVMFRTAANAAVPSSCWIQLDPENQILYALPLADNLGKHEFVLEAMDSEGASTFLRVEFHVWQHPQSEILTHAFTMTVRYNKYQFPVGIDWQIEVLKKLAQIYNESDQSNLRVLNITLDPAKMTWTNDSLPTEHCPIEIIKYIYDIISTTDHHPTKDMKKIMAPEFRVQDINVEYRGTCEGIVTTPPPPLNFEPQLRHSIGQINVTVGDIIKFKIPENTFYDFEDGGTRHLRLNLLTPENVQPPKSYWLQFDSRSQEIYGLPSDSEIGKHYFLLNAIDSDDRSVHDQVLIQVFRLPRRQIPPVEFSIQFDYDFDEFQSDTNKKFLVASKLARLYGDPDPRYISVNNITRGSVVYAWSNKTLGNDYCPKLKIDKLVKYLINEDGTLNPNLVHIMEPEFRVLSADAVPAGICLGGVPPTFVTITTTTPSPPPVELEPTLKTSTDDDIYITTILPAIVIAVMLVVAAVVAYFLYWRKRKGKMVDKDYIGSGVPVVFAGELDEQRPDPGKTPAIMKDEKPPLSTDYLLNPFRRATEALTPFTERRDTRDTLYKPPPQPYASSRGEPRSTRPKSTQAYRHATYVPP